MDIDLKEKEVSASVNNEAKAGNVTNDDVMDLEVGGGNWCRLGGYVSRDRGWEQYECEG